MNVDDGASSIIVCREGTSPGQETSPRPGSETQNDQAYHQARERGERKAAKEAASVQTRRIHQELAEAHSRMAGRFAIGGASNG
jgi:hypothetical protein